MKKKDTSKTTMFTIAAGFLILFLLYKLQWALFVSLGISVVGVSSDYLSKKIEWLWLGLAKILGYVMPNILLSLIFFVFLLPVALLSRLSKTDPLMLSSKQKSFFIEVNKTFDKNYFEKPW
jgi:hypothetical protein